MLPLDRRFDEWIRATDIYARLCIRAMRQGSRSTKLLRNVARKVDALKPCA